MATAGMESVYWRQDRYPTGGIVESDERVDGGKKPYWPYCWARTYVVEPLLVAGRFDRVRRFVDFWLKCQQPDGGLFCSNFDVRDCRKHGFWPETDNVGYMLWHFGNYVEATGDRDWLEANWRAVEAAGKFLEGKYDPELKMIWGQEEAEPPGSDKYIIRYSLHINCVCALGFISAGKLAEMRDEPAAAKRWRAIAETILSESVAEALWDEKEKTFAYGFAEDGHRVTWPGGWLTLMPFWLFDRFDDRLAGTLAYLKEHLYNKDALIPGTYWDYDFSPLLDAGKRPETKYSGYGVRIGGLPVHIDALIRAEQYDHAEEQLQKMIEFTSPEDNLIPEHVNTLHAGNPRRGYSVYPDPNCAVDPGNLLHLSFFLTLLARHDPEMLKEASHQAERAPRGPAYVGSYGLARQAVDFAQ